MDQLREPEACAKNSKASDSIVTRDFNENEHSESTKELIIEAGSHYLLTEAHRLENIKEAQRSNMGTSARIWL